MSAPSAEVVDDRCIGVSIAGGRLTLVCPRDGLSPEEAVEAARLLLDAAERVLRRESAWGWAEAQGEARRAA